MGSIAMAGYHKAVATAIQEGHEELGGQIRRLAEETALLWWVLGEYSTSLKSPVAALTSPEYALIAGAEAADRTHILPPPASADALLARALRPCKAGPKKSLALVDILEAADSGWRAGLLRRVNFSDCPDLLPLLTGLAKCEESGDPVAATKLLPKLCPGVSVEHPLSPTEAAQQLYLELMFIRALTALEMN
jgi:hypothetical protein